MLLANRLNIILKKIKEYNKINNRINYNDIKLIALFMIEANIISLYKRVYSLIKGSF